jgi:hypothetical protein
MMWAICTATSCSPSVSSTTRLVRAAAALAQYPPSDNPARAFRRADFEGLFVQKLLRKLPIDPAVLHRMHDPRGVAVPG